MAKISSCQVQGRYQYHELRVLCVCVCRFVSLEEGQGEVPCSLILLHKRSTEDTEVVGHVRLHAVAGRPAALLVEGCECSPQPPESVYS